jgi:type IV secretory pathway VirB10-like protein
MGGTPFLFWSFFLADSYLFVDDAPSMHNIYSTHHPPQAWRPVPAPITSSPQHLRIQPPVKGSFNNSIYQDPRPSQPTSYLATPSTSSPLPQHDALATQKPVLKDHEPTQYSLDNGPRSKPGTSAYYKSWAFRQKVNEGKAIVAKREDEVGEGCDDSANEDYVKKRKPNHKEESLIMVFSRTNGRRASTQRKVNERLQRFNRRM